MTNSWMDIGNATLVYIMGANPSENHPACMAHINQARKAAGNKYFTRAGQSWTINKPSAQLIVVDPRKTRTAAQADTYIRIRPGTDIAFVNGLVRRIIEWMEANPTDQKSINFFAYLNQGATDNATQTFFTNKITATSGVSASGTTIKYGSKYTDARFLVKGDGSDYVRQMVDTTGTPSVGADPATTIYDFPMKATAVTGSVTVASGDANNLAGAAVGTYDTVYTKLKTHVNPYTKTAVADICGCSEAEIELVAQAFIANSRCASYNPAAGSTIVHTPNSAYYRSTTMLYAMGITQHTVGSQNVKSFAVIQTLMGNMGRAGGGINALRGIHNVQGSTDMGLLNGNIPAYSGNPGTQATAFPDTTTNAFGKYMDALWGNPLSGRSASGVAGTAAAGDYRKSMDASYEDAYNKTSSNLGAMALQQAGFFNMTLKWFGAYDEAIALTTLSDRRTLVDKIYSLWPKGNGDQHINMFRQMRSGGYTKALVAWGQNPAITEPNQGTIRESLKNLDLLVCVDIFANETAMCDRKDNGITYLIPAASHVETGGSATNSSRTLQWRYQSRKPAGNSRSDLEIMFRLAYALNEANGFSHIKSVWDNGGTPLLTYTSVYNELFGAPYAGGWSPVSTKAFEAITPADAGVSDIELVSTGNVASTFSTATGCEVVAEAVYREMCLPSANGGTVWIYTGAYNTDYTSNKGTGTAQDNWVTHNRAKSRDRKDYNQALTYHGWGYSWLVNRRVLYNNAEVPGDVTDYFMGPDSASRLFVSTSTAVLNYSRWYRTIHRLSDVPKTAAGGAPSFHSTGLPGRFPAHTEPYETPRTDWQTWGKNSTGTAKNLLSTNNGVSTPIADVAGEYGYRGGQAGVDGTYPLVLTTIRCVEHFQGGPITRNNALNTEIEMEPWIEINSWDARIYGISDGDWVNVVTKRSNSTTDQSGRTKNTVTSTVAALDNFGSGFRAKVGVGADSNQRVGRGVVAIPWHWGEAGLSTGSRANDLCIDAFDANSSIPESKACVCRIEKA